MQIKGFGCSGYKAFRQQTFVEVRPLTIFFGRNNSGKSTLLRLPRLLLRALSSSAPKSSFPLDVSGLSYGRVFRDLIYQGFSHGSIGFDIHLVGDDGLPFELKATVQNIQNIGLNSTSRTQQNEFTVVSRWELRSPNAQVLEWESTNDGSTSYKERGKITFRGLLPEARGPWAFLDVWQKQIDELQEATVHLGPLRAPILPAYELTEPQPIGFTGAEAMMWLAQDRDLLRSVSAWYEKYLDGWRLSLESGSNTVRATLSRGGTTVNLADTGQGMQQILPLVVQQYLRDGTKPFLDLFEQPELHLDSAVQAPLGDLLLQTANKRGGTVIVETHSENLILRVRRRIAERADGIDPSLVALYWVDERSDGYSEIKPIPILPNGDVTNWPKGVFSEGYEEVKALGRAQRQHRPEGT